MEIMEQKNKYGLLISALLILLISFIIFKSIYSALEAAFLVFFSYFILKSLWKKEDETILLIISVIIIFLIEPISKGEVIKSLITSFSKDPIKNLLTFMVMTIYLIGLIFMFGGVASIIFSLYNYYRGEKLQKMRENIQETLTLVSSSINNVKKEEIKREEENLNKNLTYSYKEMNYNYLNDPINNYKIELKHKEEEIYYTKLKVLMENLNSLNEILSEIVNKNFDKCELKRGEES